MNNQNKVQLTINIINNDEKNLICNCCSRPILPNEFDEIIDLNYKNAPEFIKIHFKNEFLNNYKNLKKSNLPLNKLPRRLNLLIWDNFLKTNNWVNFCNKIIENLISNEELNLTYEDEKRFRKELNVLIENNNFFKNSYEDSHKHLHDHNHEHSHNNSFEHNI